MVQVQKKKKKWYPIIAPKDFNNMELGETLIDDPELPLDRKINVTLANILNDFKKQNLFLTFKLTGVKDNKIETSLDGFETSLSHVKRMTRATKDKIEDSFTMMTKDGVCVRIKPILIIKNKINKSIKSKLQKKLRDTIVRYTSQVEFIVLLNDIVSFKIQKEVQKELKNIYPLFSLLIKTAYKETNLKKGKTQVIEVSSEVVKEPDSEEEIVEEVIEEKIEEIPVEEVKEEKPKKEKKAKKKE